MLPSMFTTKKKPSRAWRRKTVQRFVFQNQKIPVKDAEKDVISFLNSTLCLSDCNFINNLLVIIFRDDPFVPTVPAINASFAGAH